MTVLSDSYSLGAVRALALRSQGLADRHVPGPIPPTDEIYAVVDRIGAVQIDTLQMVHRSQYLVMWSRLGCYAPADFDLLLSSESQRRLFEYWLHAACVIPLSEYRFRLPTMRRYREGNLGWHLDWLDIPDHVRLIESVREHVRSNGPVRAADFDNTGPRRGSWWDWKPAKRALEHLYDWGDLMISGRVKFQRVYDMSERVLPDWVDTTEPTYEEASRHMLERSMRALGVCGVAQVADYTHMKRNEAKPILESLVADGTFATIRARLHDGEDHPLVVHRDDLATLEEARDGAAVPSRTTFLSPFDNLFWARDRDTQFWGFRQILEAYKPVHLREWGYFCLPILCGDRLVGRFDPKLERKTGIMRLRAIYLEQGVNLDEELVSDIAGAMRDFLVFHGATDLVIETSNPAEFGKKLLAAL